VTLEPGPYTAIVRGVNTSTGLALAEVYDLDPMGGPSRLSNISTRGLVLTGDNVMIGGFIAHGPDRQRVVVRVIGPSLPLPVTLQDPRFTIHDANGAIIAANDSWLETPEGRYEIITVGMRPSHLNEPALMMTVSPGNYTAIVRGDGVNDRGVALFEVYSAD
jgi:hypothetical protein